MPTVGIFHRNFWRARANTPLPPGVSGAWMYPQIQSVVTMMCALPGFVPWSAVKPAWQQAVWIWSLARRLWWVRSPWQRAAVEVWAARAGTLTTEQASVLERALGVMQGPSWAVARAQVQACATSPKFHQPEQWVAYGRAVKANPGQAQNVWRHMKVVFGIQAETGASNPDAHLAAELAYHAMAAQGRPDRVIVHHAHI